MFQIEAENIITKGDSLTSTMDQGSNFLEDDDGIVINTVSKNTMLYILLD